MINKILAFTKGKTGILLLLVIMSVLIFSQNPSHSQTINVIEEESPENKVISTELIRPFESMTQKSFTPDHGNPAIVLNDGPGTIIENQVFNGENITLVDSPNSIIRGNTITNMTGEVIYGIYLINSSGTVIQDNVISDLTGSSSVYGIYVLDSFDVEIRDNEINALTSLGGTTLGISQGGEGNAEIADNFIHDLSGGYVGGIDLRMTSGETDIVSSNTVSGLIGDELNGILSFGNNAGIVMSNGIFDLTSSATGGTSFGIALIGQDFEVHHNEVNYLIVTGDGLTYVYGIAVSALAMTITNNSIANIHAESSASQVNLYGIYAEYATETGTIFSDNSIQSLVAIASTNAYVFGLYFFSMTDFIVEYSSISILSATGSNGILEFEIFMVDSYLATFNFIEGSTYPVIWTSDAISNHDLYYLYRDTVNIESDVWVDGGDFQSTQIRIDTDLTSGVYTYAIVIIDTVSGNTPISDTIIVNILPVVYPVLVSSTGSFVEYGTTGNVVQWRFVDNNPDYAEIYLNATLVANSTWISGVEIMYNLDGLAVGEYNFTILVYDEDGNTANDTVFIDVDDTLLPEIDYFGKDTFEQESVISNMTWYVSDLNPDYFSVFANGTSVLNGTWENEAPITLSLYDWDLGMTNFTIVVEDAFGNSVSLTVIVLVVDTLAPALNEPTDIVFNEGDFGIDLEWIAEDFNAANWSLFENEVNYLNGTWVSGEPISFILDDYKLGRYNFTIFVWDTFGNIVADTVWVNVLVGSDNTYTRNTDTVNTGPLNPFGDIDPIYLAAGGAIIGVATIGSVLRRRGG